MNWICAPRRRAVRAAAGLGNLGIGELQSDAMLVCLDCDPGVDDALALGYLLAHPEVDLALVTSVSGNVDATTGARNALDLLAAFGRPDIPVAIGATDFLAAPFAGSAAPVHGDNGLGGVELPRSPAEPIAASGAEAIVELARSRPGDLRILAIGPLTNLALALDLEPRLPELVRDVVVMGGACLAPGNITPAAEANIFHDPEAALRVVDAPWDVTLVPLDATMHQRFTADDADALRGSDRPVVRALGEMLEFYMGFYLPALGSRAAALHDPLAAGVLTGEAVPTRAMTVDVDVDTTTGPGRGATIADLRGIYHPQPRGVDHGVRVVLEVGADFAPTLRTRLLATPPVE